MAPTPSSKSNQGQQTMPRTPQSKHRLLFATPRGTPLPKESQPSDHPVEVIGRIRTHPERKEKPNSAFQVNPDRRMIRVRADFGYRDFTLDGISSCEGEDLDSFYNKFVKERINAVKMGNKCTIMMYGPTGSGKSHTMFGCSKQPGIVYNSLKDILGEDDQNDAVVQVTVLEIYNEEVYDLLSSSNNGGFISFSRGGASKARLEVIGKKAKNATSISGNEAAKISKEIQKVEKRRIVKNTLCNERSSRSHCLITLDVPAVGGRLMLVDMAGSENIEQAGQVGLEAKMQTGKINQGNIALRRVVESIANGDSHVPFRDSKLTMLLQDSFEDDKSKILMILCASPDIKEIHKTISTLEYGAKAKCIVRGPHTPVKDKIGADDSSAVVLCSRIAAMDQFISKLQMENKLREKERNEAQKEVIKKEEEVALLRSKVEAMESRATGLNEEDVGSITARFEKKMEDCERMTNEFIVLGRRRMEEKIFLQQQELEILRRRLEEIEVELCLARGENFEGSGFVKRLVEACADEEPGMVKSMDLDLDETEASTKEDDNGSVPVRVSEPAGLSTVFEEEEEEEEEENVEEEVKKEVVEEKMISSCRAVKNHDPAMATGLRDALENKHPEVEQLGEAPEDTAISRRMRIQNIFTLCGNYRELSQRMRTSTLPNELETDDLKSTLAGIVKSADEEKEKLITTVIEEEEPALKPNPKSSNEEDGMVEVYVKWEASKENPGKFITTLKVAKDSSLSDLRKLIEIHLGSEKQAFTFVVLGDPSGNHVPKEKEATIKTIKLPICNNQLRGLVACLRPVKGNDEEHRLPLRSMENKLPRTPKSCASQSDCFSPEFIAVRRY